MADPEAQQEGEVSTGAAGGGVAASTASSGAEPAAAAVPAPTNASASATDCCDLTGHAIIAGYGIPGRAVGEAMKSKGIEFCVVERNADTVRRCARGGVRIFAGDATKEDTLRRAGIERASVFAATMPNDHSVIEAVTQARRLNPAVRILARLEYVSNGMKATRRGADEVVIAEQVVGQAFKCLLEAGVPYPCGDFGPGSPVRGDNGDPRPPPAPGGGIP